MSARRVLSTTGHVALELLRAVDASADAFPPLKSAAGGALHIAEIVMNFKSNKKDWHEFQVYVQDVVASAIESLAHSDVPKLELKAKSEKLQSTLQSMILTIESRQNQSGLTRFFEFMKDPEEIQGLKAQLNEAVALFNLSATIVTGIQVTKTLEAVEKHTKLLSDNALQATLVKLPYAKGASWDLRRVCLQDTRIKIIQDILSWVESAKGDDKTNIFLLTAVAGAGKSTIAHTIAQQCSEHKQLVTAFFFDRDTEGRNSPNTLFSTLAADLAHREPHLAERIAAAVEDDISLPHASISRQFDQLIRKPCEDRVIEEPMVIVIDGLDEGWDDDLLDILRDEASHLPKSFRILLTSRMRPELESLQQRSHVRSATLDIHGSENMMDIAQYIAYMLRQLADRRNLGKDWPGEQLRKEFADKAGGLFQWVATICEYLRTRANPTKELVKLVSASGSLNTSAESKMDKLYSMILDACDWSDEEFVEGYRRLMGAAIATKTPLTIYALNSLHNDEEVASDFVLQQLSPLLTGVGRLEQKSQPVRFLHQSLRDFLTLRARNSTEYQRFEIREREYSQNLALLCLRVLNRDLSNEIPGTGYLAKDESEVAGVPGLPDDSVSEALSYACRFWINHVIDTDVTPSGTLVEELEVLLRTKAVLWVEVLASIGKFQGFSEVRGWVERLNSDRAALRTQLLDVRLADALDELSSRLTYMDRLEEALLAQEGAVELRRAAAGEPPAVSPPNLANSLQGLSSCLTALGRPEDALLAIQEAVTCYQQLAKDLPGTFTADLASSLVDLADCLSGLGYREDALEAVKKAVDYNRQLTEESLTAYVPDLANSLNVLSSCLSELGRQEEALGAIQEAVELRRKLAKDQPAAFTPDLSESLNELSLRLSDLGQREEALAAMQETVKLYRQLATDRPAAFTPELAMSLNNLSLGLSDLGHREEALIAIQEASKLYRQLAKDRPASFIPDLALSLNSLSLSLSDLGHREEALAAIQEAVMLRRQMVIDRPAAFTPDLAVALDNLSDCLSSLNRQDEALAAVQEAFELFRQLANDRPAAFMPDLAASLNNLSLRLSDLGRRDDALATAQEAVDLYRELAKSQPAAFIPSLADTLDTLSRQLPKIGRQEEALVAVQEAVDLYRQLAKDQPAAFNPNLAGSLHVLSLNHSALGHHEEALSAAREAQELYRSLALKYSAVFSSDLATVSRHLCKCFSNLGREEEAQTVLREMDNVPTA